MVSLLAQDLFEVEVRGEIGRLCTGIGCVAHKIEVFGDAKSLLCTHAKTARSNLQQIDCVDTKRACLGRALPLHICYISRSDMTHTLLDRLNNSLVVHLATMPL